MGIFQVTRGGARCPWVSAGKIWVEVAATVFRMKYRVNGRHMLGANGTLLKMEPALAGRPGACNRSDPV